MTHDQHNPRNLELIELIGAVREDRCTPDQAARLNDLLANDPAARSYYIRVMLLTADLHQASANECNIRRRIEDRQLAHAIADEHLGIHRAIVSGAAANRAESLFDGQRGHGLKPLRMPRNHQQQCIWKRVQNLATFNALNGR